MVLKYVPRFRTMEHIIVKTGMNNDDIIEAVNNCPNMRLINLSRTKRLEAKTKDELVVTHFPLNREYGCVVDRAQVEAGKILLDKHSVHRRRSTECSNIILCK